MKNAKRFSWSEYFGNADKVNQTHNGTALYDTTSPKNYYVFICIFENCTENGAIHIERSNDLYVLLEESVFNRCKSTSGSGGGSVYFYGYLAGHIVQQRNCYFKSIDTSFCNAFFHKVPPTNTNENYVFEISVSDCGESESEGSYTFYMAFGDVQIKNNNITYNKCNSGSSIVSDL
ncbi:hypothetical protein TVAG_003620 [Trichomonas vaginalis G3]|uniref:Uncharacterized protein n=1 Tax=Trichomonas vaginalis (strain ATCC PRA-98 / G3) TaxID=412133 RepID=A2E576_TRIV3|nr:hypothetical protein TVAGG3_0475630 [Trichomonas vaginalis G3]EAY12156.1 hypothetical protein TVAG_003620 [Trichomonas vaginalis G3]KAI5515379.1 hypothetical protein TVAGG3_0475630 [Trichomonas vaginalis G3]|eukprot:XP_001324379.1 hypothetical protein [Trichomonas vaginalis G3]